MISTMTNLQENLQIAYNLLRAKQKEATTKGYALAAEAYEKSAQLLEASAAASGIFLSTKTPLPAAEKFEEEPATAYGEHMHFYNQENP